MSETIWKPESARRHGVSAGRRRLGPARRLPLGFGLLIALAASVALWVGLAVVAVRLLG